MSAVYISATSHLIKHQIWTWLFVWLRFCVLSGHTDAGQRPAHFASRLQSHRRPICLCGGNFMVKVRTRSFFFFFAFEKLESYLSYLYLFREERASKQNPIIRHLQYETDSFSVPLISKENIACFIRYPCY